MAFRAVEGLRIECVTPDILHAVDQGVCTHVLGNIFYEVIQKHCFGGNDIDSNTKALYSDMKAWYAANRDSSKFQGKLTIQRIKTSNDWPKLKAKAACTRHLIKYGIDLSTRFNDGTVHDRRRLAVATLLGRWYELIDTTDRRFSDGVVQELKTIGRDFMGLYTGLSLEASRTNTRAWKLVPKFHVFQRLSEWVPEEWGNPRFFWTYADEDMIGSLCEIGASCHPNTLSETALVQWLVLFRHGVNASCSEV